MACCCRGIAFCGVALGCAVAPAVGPASRFGRVAPAAGPDWGGFAACPIVCSCVRARAPGVGPDGCRATADDGAEGWGGAEGRAACCGAARCADGPGWGGATRGEAPCGGAARGAVMCGAGRGAAACGRGTDACGAARGAGAACGAGAGWGAGAARGAAAGAGCPPPLPGWDCADVAAIAEQAISVVAMRALDFHMIPSPRKHESTSRNGGWLRRRARVGATNSMTVRS